MTLQLPPQQEWYFDSRATSHMTSDGAPLTGSLFPPQLLSVTAPFSLLPPLALPPFLGPFILTMFLFPRTLLRILLPFTSLHLTIIALWNLTHLVALSRIFSLGTRSSGTISLYLSTHCVYLLLVPLIPPLQDPCGTVVLVCLSSYR